MFTCKSILGIVVLLLGDNVCTMEYFSDVIIRIILISTFLGVFKTVLNKFEVSQNQRLWIGLHQG